MTDAEMKKQRARRALGNAESEKTFKEHYGHSPNVSARMSPEKVTAIIQAGKAKRRAPAYKKELAARSAELNSGMKKAKSK
jgi:hypothetical protein